jgi:threonine/homoserine/homoserine lactone efflux protein
MIKELLPVALTVIFAHFLALLSPGPDFILVVKSGIRNKKQNAVGIALGIATANAAYIALCIIGVGEILTRSLLVMRILKVCGGLFLTYVAVMALKTRKSDYDYIKRSIDGDDSGRISFLREFATGFVSGISNPKNLIFYLSLFSLVLDERINILFKVSLGVWMTAMVFAWDAFIIFILSKRTIKQWFSGFAFYVDKVAGTVLGLIGLRLIQTAVIDDK